MRLFRPFFFAGWFYPDALFRIKTTEKVLYLTFDDGPDPIYTPQLLKILKRYDLKALFFCGGKAAEKYPDLMNQILTGGHLVGNHGYNHLNGWRTDSVHYIDDFRKASVLTSVKFFRPPFGHLSFKQYRKLKKNARIVFWDLMPYDFDVTFGGKKSLEILKKKLRPGSIIVLHDKAASCASIILEEFLIFALSKGYRFDLIDVVS